MTQRLSDPTPRRHASTFKTALAAPWVFATLLLPASPAQAQGAAELAKKRNCMSCHAIENKVVGPSFKDIAARYAKDKGAADRLATKIMKGGGGSWGVLAMPANNQVRPEEAQVLATWVLGQK